MLNFINSRYGEVSGVSKLEALSDVDFTNLQNNGILIYNDVTGKWEIRNYVPGEAILSDTFKTIASTGQTSLIADSATDTLNIEVNGNSTFNNLQITTDSLTDTLDISLSDTPAFDYIDFDLLTNAVAWQQGRVWYNVEDDTLNIGHENGSIQQVGQEFYLPPTKNNSGVEIKNGELVMFTGVHGDKITIAKAISDGTYSSDLMLGVATQNITIDSESGKITTNGLVRNVNTNGWPIGTILYHDPLVPGGFTNIKPDAPAIRIPIAVVIKTDEIDGWIYVRMNWGSELGETDSNVKFSNLQNDQLIMYDNTNNIWVNKYHPLGTDIQRCGFLNQTETGLFFNGTNVEVTNAGTTVPAYSFQLYDSGSGWSYYLNGIKYTVSGNRTILIPDNLAGTYYITIQNNSEGNLSISTTIWDLTDPLTIPVAIVRFNSLMNPTYYIEEERHTIKIDRRNHLYNHTTRGTIPIVFGELNGYSLNTATNEATTFGITSSKIADEDIILTLDELTDQNGVTDNYTIFVHNGVTWEWTRSPYPFLYETNSYIKWDNNGTLTTGIQNSYYTTYIWFTNFIGDGKYIITLGRGQYSKLSDALAEDPHNFDWSGIDIAEYVLAYQLVWSTSSSNNNIGKVTLAAEPKKINITTVSATSTLTATHNGLSGLQGGTVGQYYHLNASDYTNVQTLIANNSFGKLSVSGQSDVIADSYGDTLTFIAGENITITTDPLTDSITFTGVAGGETYTAGTGLDLTGTVFSLESITAGSTAIGAVAYNGTTKADGKFDGGTTAPTNTTRLNYDGYFYATKFYGDGSALSGIVSGATLSNDTTTDTTQYLGMSRNNSGAWTTAYVADTKLYFNPSTGTLNSTAFNSLSDINFKTNITPITNATFIIDQIEGVEFDWKENGIKSAGVIAQQLEQVLPHLVSTNKDGIKSVNYDGIIGYLIESNKELSNRVLELENKIATLK